jgi:hypothetical protein
VHEALLADPGLVADGELVLVVALDDAVVADVHVAAESDVLRVEDQHPGLEDAVRADGPELLG